MQMVASSRLRKDRELMEQARSCADSMERIFSCVASLTDLDSNIKFLHFGDLNSENKNADCVKKKHVLIIMISSERGLCGGFNANLVRNVTRKIASIRGEGHVVKVISIGKKGYDLLRRSENAIITDYHSLTGINSRDRMLDISKGIATQIISKIDNFDECILMYSKFRSVIVNEQIAQTMFPIYVDINKVQENNRYETEPSPEIILKHLLHLRCKMMIYHAMTESFASEQGSRMSAMDGATRNAGEILGGLTVAYNRQRQAGITSELIEIISGAEAL